MKGDPTGVGMIIIKKYSSFSLIKQDMAKLKGGKNVKNSAAMGIIYFIDFYQSVFEILINFSNNFIL